MVKGIDLSIRQVKLNNGLINDRSGGCHSIEVYNGGLSTCDKAS
jgi:hypothetical protein